MEELIPVFKVSELNRGIKELLEGSFTEVWVEGEISGFKESSLGHCYFDLKDEKSIISCVLFKWAAAKVKFDLENGLLVKVRAGVTIYDKQSKYQLQVKEMISLKYGPLQLAFEQLKEKLKKEGLFEEGRKKKIPKFPSKIAVVTSLQGAAVRDILSILKRRHSGLHIIVYPVKVQGEGAKEEIAAAVTGLNENFSDIDVMLVGRGGGSMEDLWAFNEEIVARAIAGSGIPVISCVGHETDFTIADFVADLRAPTPSAAAELVVANREDLVNHLKQMEKRLLQSLKISYGKMSGKFFKFVNSRYFRNPYALIERQVQRFDQNFEYLFMKMDNKLKNSEYALTLQSEKLKNLSPYFPLKKGYSLVKKENKLVRKAADLKTGEMLEISFIDGKAESEVKNISMKKEES
ncbi:MAG: exodeoxyribonuclease VII large subunit [Elusimicrobia bacterium CG08_land_8_20_14_0_20_51_18]|nr:MAG: exodeoxyribonuclease VII large subunit [Elusimicrobia bacterium CG08_land_8_20_14_0_20_51_18]